MTKPTNKSKQRKNDILKATQALFISKGFQETSINDIMRKAGAAKGAFYYYFESKDQVLDILIQQQIDKIVLAVEKVLDQSGLNALQKLQRVLEEEFKANMEDYDPDNHLHSIKNVDMHQRILEGMVRRFAPVIAGVINQGIDEGLFKTEYPLEASEIIIAGVNFITDYGIFRWTRDEYLRRIKASEELIEKALSIEPGSFSFLSEMLGGTSNMVYKNVTEK